MPDSQLTPEEIKKLLQNAMKHPYIEKYIHEPFIDESKLLMLSEMSRNVELAKDRKGKIIIPFMLVQIALDTHERIPNANTSTMKETEKQLSVLAGDFYSGLYYYLLADIGQIKLIKILAHAIKQINEYKMTMFYGEVTEANDLIQLATAIESSILNAFREAFDINQQFFNLIQTVSRYNIIKDELLAHIHKGEYMSKYNLINQVNHNEKQNFIKTLERLLTISHEGIKSLLNEMSFETDGFQATLFNNIKLMYSTSLAEEG